MSQIAITGNVLGSGTITITSSNSNSDRTLTLPDQTATLITNSSDVLNIGAGQLYKAADGNVGIGTSSPSAKLEVVGNVVSGNISTARVTATGNAIVGGNLVLNGNVANARLDVNGSIAVNIVSVPALDIDCSQGTFFTKTVSGASTFTFSNVPQTRAYSFVLELTFTSGTVGWPASVQWPGGTAPTLTTGKIHLLIFVTDNGGTTWLGASSINYNT